MVRIRKREEPLWIIEKTDSASEVFHLGRKFAKKAEESLLALPKNKWNNMLQALVSYVVERKK